MNITRVQGVHAHAAATAIEVHRLTLAKSLPANLTPLTTLFPQPATTAGCIPHEAHQQQSTYAR